MMKKNSILNHIMSSYDNIYQNLIFVIYEIGFVTVLNEDVVVQDLLNKVIFVALDDGIITQDELAILKQVKLDINTIRDKLKSHEDELESNSTEAKILDEFSKNIVQNAYEISQTDEVITDDERKLINTLIKVLLK